MIMIIAGWLQYVLKIDQPQFQANSLLIEDCSNGIDDDNDGFVDHFDLDCDCLNNLYFAGCEWDCVIEGDIDFTYSLEVDWSSEYISDRFIIPGIVTGDIDSDGDIEVLSVESIATGGVYESRVIILDGKTGELESSFSFNSNTNFPNFSHLALGKINTNDIYPHIFFIDKDPYALVCFDVFGNKVWESSPLVRIAADLINLADFNSDGVSEIYIGNQIFNAQNGILLLEGSDGQGCNKGVSNFDQCNLMHSIAAELLPDPGLELAAGNTVYSIDITNLNGTIGNSMTSIFADPIVLDGLTSVADIDSDGQLDVIVNRATNYANGGGLWIWNPRTGGIIASGAGGRGGGVPSIGNVDDDCSPEIIVIYRNQLIIYDYDGSQILVERPVINIPEESSNTSTTLFDFDGDDNLEIVVNDEFFVKIVDGNTNSVTTQIPLFSGTLFEAPIISDIDSDDQAEILVVGYETVPDSTKIYCLQSGSSNWMPSRSIWNQYGYHTTNVNDDLSIPINQQNQASFFGVDCTEETCPQVYNSFKTQVTYRTQDGCLQHKGNDLSIDVIDVNCIDSSIIVTTVVSSLNLVSEFNNCIDIAMYENSNPEMNTPSSISNQCFDLIYYSINEMYLDTLLIQLDIEYANSQIFISINDDGGGILNSDYSPISGLEECFYTNNIDSFYFNHEVLNLELGVDIVKCENETFTLNIDDRFEIIRWNNGSFDSNITSSEFGLFYVEAIDHCGNVYTDSLMVIEDTSFFLTMADHIQVCENDTIEVIVDSNFDTLFWNPDPSILCTDCNPLQIFNPSIDELIIYGMTDNCISQDTIRFELKNEVFINVDTTICEGSEFKMFGYTFSEEGIYTELINDCDSTLNLSLNIDVIDTTVIQETICTNDSIFFVSSWYKEEGEYQETEIGITGCPSLTILYLNVIDSVYTSENIESCIGDTIMFNGQLINIDTIIKQNLVSFAGCDSIVETQISFNEEVFLFEDYEICFGDSVLIYDNYYSVQGEYNIQIEGFGECDSIIYLTLNVNESYVIDEHIESCEGDYIAELDLVAISDTVVSRLLVASNGCDSLVIYELEIVPLEETQIEINLCKGDSIQINQDWISEEGLYFDTIDGLDCIELISYNVFVYNTFDLYIDTTICWDENIVINQQNVSQTGSYIENLSSINGCDSIVMYDLEVISEPFEPVFDLDCIEELIYAEISVDENWIIEWSNGSHLFQTEFHDPSPINLVLVNSIVGCSIEYGPYFFNLPWVDPLPSFADEQVSTGTELNYNIELDEDDWNILWNTNANVDCVTCFNAVINVEEDSNIDLELTHLESGCVYIRSWEIMVTDKDSIYIPNIFSLSSLNNREWRVINTSNGEIIECNIYDRWGNLVFSSDNSNVIIWDGYFNGEPLEQGVYVYTLEYLSANHETEILVGDITLIR